MLAWVDGKSPAEYIVKPETRAEVRGIARSILLDNLATLTEVTGLVNSELGRPGSSRPGLDQMSPDTTM
ncbi:MAG TPA: hypothetical protein VFR55_06080 [Dehalococcoidia bacterium]|nr:hypothetical protein [Dehalococcoidia bacterium]